MKFETRNGTWQFVIDPSPSFVFNLHENAVWLETTRLPKVLTDAVRKPLLFNTVRNRRKIVHTLASASCLYKIDNQFHLAFLCNFTKALWTNSRETETTYIRGFRVVCGYTCSRGWLFVEFSRSHRRQQHVFFFLSFSRQHNLVGSPPKLVFLWGFFG